MTTIYSRLNDFKGMVYHLEKVIKSGDFISNDLCNYGFWRCYDQSWSQQDFFEYGKFVEKNLKEYPSYQKCEIPVHFAKNLSKNIRSLAHDDVLCLLQLYHQRQNVLSIQKIVAPPQLMDYKSYDEPL